MTDFAQAAQDLADMLEAGTPYEADVNPQDLNLPGYWVTPVRRVFETLDTSSCTCIFDVFAVAQAAPVPMQALAELSKMQDALNASTLPALNGAGNDGEITYVQLSNKSPDALPALKFTITLEVE